VKDFFGRNKVWVLALLGVVLIYIGEKAVGEKVIFYEWTLATLPKVGWLILGTAIVNYLYEMHGKKAVLDQVRLTLGVRESIDRSGVLKATLEPKEVPWDSLITTTRKIDLSVSYANTWRNSHIKQLREAARNRVLKFRLLLPDPDCNRLMESLGARYGLDPGTVRDKVREAKEFFLQIFRDAKALPRCDIRFSSQEITYAYHRFDDVSVVTFYHGLGKIGQVPTLELNANGEMAILFSKDFEKAFEEARRAN